MIETMIAVTVFVVAVVSLIGVYPATVRASRQAHGQLVAANLAEKELEFTRAMEYDAIETRQKDYALRLETNGVPTDVDFETRLEVSQVREGLKRLEVTVRWQGTDRMNRSLKMETYVARLTP